MTQLQAGFILDSVKQSFEKKYSLGEVDGLLKQLSFFDIEIYSTTQKSVNNYEQILCVAHNIISRGLPTKPSLWIEDKILQAYNITNQDQKLLEIGTIKQDLETSISFIEKLFRALHIIDPEIRDNNISKNKIISWENLGSSFEEDFLYEQLPKYVGQHWVQLFENQREIESILRFSTTTKDEVDKYIKGTIQVYNEQRIDFSVEFPYPINDVRGLVLEIDGSQHNEAPQQQIDTDRDIVENPRKLTP